MLLLYEHVCTLVRNPSSSISPDNDIYIYVYSARVAKEVTVLFGVVQRCLFMLFVRVIC